MEDTKSARRLRVEGGGGDGDGDDDGGDSGESESLMYLHDVDAVPKEEGHYSRQ